MAKGWFTVDELENAVFKTMKFQGRWYDSFGQPELKGTWIIYGRSYNGKTTFTLQLTKYLSEFVKHKIIYNSLEEGKSESLKLSSIREALSTVRDKIVFGDRRTIEQVKERLAKQRSPEIVITDSLQYTDLNKIEYKKLKKEYPHVLWIFISHADGKNGETPRGALAKYLQNDADVKIRVYGFKAFVESRYGGGEEYIIDAERAAKYCATIEN